jgi:hypothetical protein
MSLRVLRYATMLSFTVVVIFTILDVFFIAVRGRINVIITAICRVLCRVPYVVYWLGYAVMSDSSRD